MAPEQAFVNSDDGSTTARECENLQTKFLSNAKLNAMYFTSEIKKQVQRRKKKASSALNKIRAPRQEPLL